MYAGLALSRGQDRVPNRYKKRYYAFLFYAGDLTRTTRNEIILTNLIRDVTAVQYSTVDL